MNPLLREAARGILHVANRFVHSISTDIHNFIHIFSPCDLRENKKADSLVSCPQSNVVD